MTKIVTVVLGLAIGFAFVWLGRWAYFHPTEIRRKFHGDLNFEKLDFISSVFGVICVACGSFVGAASVCLVLVSPLSSWPGKRPLAIAVSLAATAAGRHYLLKGRACDAG
jgi:hypothetical protein